MVTSFRVSLLCATIFLGHGGTCEAVVVISNFPPTNDNAVTIVTESGGTLAKFAGFSMPAGNPYTLDSLTLRLSSAGSGSLNNGDLTVELLGDSSGDPDLGNVLTSFVNPTFNGSGIFDYVFSPTALVLQPSTPYWVHVTGLQDTFAIGWLGANPGQTPVGLATSIGYRLDDPTSSSSLLNTFQIDATRVVPQSIIPEPSTLTLAALGFLALIRRRRRK